MVGLLARVARGGDARDAALTNRSGFPSLGHMGGPSLTGFGLDLCEAHPGGWIRNADQDLARRANDLTTGELRLALQGLVAVGTVEFEFVCVHTFQPIYAQSRREKYIRIF